MKSFFRSPDPSALALCHTALAQNPCPELKLTVCQLAFYKSLGLAPPSPPLVNGAAQLQTTINANLTQGGAQYEMQLCSAYQDLFVCLGPDRQSCLSVIGFIGAQNDYFNATLFATLFTQIDSRCSGICELGTAGCAISPPAAFLQNMQCVQNQLASATAAINSCNSIFQQSLGSGRQCM